MKVKVYRGYCYEIHPTGVKMWKEGEKKDDRLTDNWYFKPESSWKKKEGHPSIHKWKPATDEQVKKMINSMLFREKVHNAHLKKVSDHKKFKYKVGDYLLHTMEFEDSKYDSTVLYKIKSTSKSEYGHSYNLKGVRVIKCRDPKDHRVHGIYSPFAHVVEKWGEFKKVEGKELEKLMTQGFAV